MAELSYDKLVSNKAESIRNLKNLIPQFLKKNFTAKFKDRNILLVPANGEKGAIGAGLSYGGKNFVTHSRLHHNLTAIETFTLNQKLLIASILIFAITALILFTKITAIIFIAALSLTYFLDLLFSIFVVKRSIDNVPEIKIKDEQLARIVDTDLPIYSILCPLYREAGVLPEFVEAITNIDWPKDKLDVLLLLEEDDQNTIEAARSLNLPDFFRILIVPHSLPKTKPKACNYGLAHVKGEYMVVYDAEDRPEPSQLKKVYLAFQELSAKVICLQCKLNYYNPNQNLLTRFFTAEYTLWFDLILPGLQSLSTTIPLGGTSNHFRIKALRYLDGWDPFNVTEDCDLGTRIFKSNFKTAVVDSVTLEEANSNYKGWIKQRSRWLKGYLQTYLVHMRNPIDFYKKHGRHALIFQLVTGIRIVFTLVNPVMWLVTISYFAFRSTIGETIESLYPMPIFYIASLTNVFGNFFYIYLYMIACAKNGRWELIKYIYLIPFYWFSASIAASIAFYQLIVNPHYWEKTAHGLGQNKIKEAKKKAFPRKIAIDFELDPFPAFSFQSFAINFLRVKYAAIFVGTTVFLMTFFVLTKISF